MNDQRLVPFLGGLIVGGVAGSQTAPYNRPNYYYYPQQYYYPYYYPYNNYYQTYPVVQQTSTYPYNSYSQEVLENNLRGVKVNDISFVPIYNQRLY